MSPLFTAIVVILALLAVMGIVVGVANDAVNFLNSALGSKVAPRRVILWIAAAGILVGTLTSSGMMEVARSGVFYPGQFSFQEIMMLFLGMMLGNILLLDLYNTLGLPTSTTVSMVFGLLGAAVAAALFRIAGDPGTSLQDLSQFINTGKAMVIIAAILLSVALAFVAGTLFMYISRLIFSFRYAAVFRRWGAVWCGISLAGILYFALFKGLKSSGLIPTSVSAYVGDHVLVTLLAFWAAASLLLYIFQRMRLNIMRITILSGTFSLALAFAGNDLVNFIGVPLAGYDAWRIAGEAGSETMMMGALEAPARANFLLLGVSGLIMVLTLFFSKKSQHVTETELSLASQHEGEERFGSTFISRSLVRATLVLNTMWTGLIPVRMQKAIDHLEEELLNVRAGKASPNALNGVMVDYFGSQVPVSGAASVTVPDARTILIQPWDKNMLRPIEKAIIDSNIGLTPSNNGEQIRLTIPPLTEERRKELVKQVRAEAETARISLRNARRDAVEAFKKAQKEGMPEDESKDGETQSQKLLEKFSKTLDEALSKKEKEIMTV